MSKVLWPNTHERASLLYSIIKGKKINVGMIIHDLILKSSKNDIKDGLSHPLLIYGLCIEAGLAVGFDEEINPLKYR